MLIRLDCFADFRTSPKTKDLVARVVASRRIAKGEEWFLAYGMSERSWRCAAYCKYSDLVFEFHDEDWVRRLVRPFVYEGL